MAKKVLKTNKGAPPGISTEASQGPVGKRIATTKYLYEEPITYLLRHYILWVNDMNTRRTRKNGWNDTISAYMGKLPPNWPFLAMVTDPRIRTTILEKSARLLNAKLQGRLIPRYNSDMIKAKINNAILDFQWDYANDGGSMVDKLSRSDQIARIFGACFVQTFWDNKKNSNEIKLIDPRDIGFDGAATHIRNARWVQVREWTTYDKLEQRGYNMSRVKEAISRGEVQFNQQSTAYESIVKSNRALINRVGEFDNPNNPILEVVTEWTTDDYTIYLPRYAIIVKKGANPYLHGKIPISQLNYYPMLDDVYGESEVEAVMPLQKALNAILCGFLDEMNISMKPPLKISSSGVRIDTIQYGPGAQWIMQNPNQVVEAQIGGQTVQNFNATYPAMVAAFNTAMGSESLGTSNVRGQFDEKTATEVTAIGQQQTTRDQYNQLYLSEFLQDMMMLWLSNNKQYLFDDPTKEYFVLKIIGKDNIQYFQQMKLDDMDIPDFALKHIANTIQMAPNAITPASLSGIIKDVMVPRHPVMTEHGGRKKSPVFSKKLNVKSNDEAELYVTREDLDGEFDYIPDVKSMAAGAGKLQIEARQQALQMALNPQTVQLLQQQGIVIKLKDLLINAFEDAGYKDAETLFEDMQQQQPMGQPGLQVPPQMNGQPTQQAGFGAAQAGTILNQPKPNGGMGVPQGVPPAAGGGGIPSSI